MMIGGSRTRLLNDTKTFLGTFVQCQNSEYVVTATLRDENRLVARWPNNTEKSKDGNE